MMQYVLLGVPISVLVLTALTVYTGIRGYPKTNFGLLFLSGVALIAMAFCMGYDRDGLVHMYGYDLVNLAVSIVLVGGVVAMIASPICFGVHVVSHRKRLAAKNA
jgi:uncharacterized PurR-regulated membrane protein YhhQ (DUF165 family)